MALSESNAGIYPASLTNVEAEQALLGSLLVTNEEMVHVLFLHARHFYEPLHQRIFAAMVDCWEKQRPFTQVMLKPVFENDPALSDIGGGGNYLSRLAAGALHVIDVRDYAQAIVDMAQRRALYTACKDAADMIERAQEGDPLHVAMTLAQKFQDVSIGYNEPLFQDDYEITEAILEDIKKDFKPYPTGITLLDLAMDGGLYPGKSYGFAARKKVGKTNLAATISCNLNISGTKHLFICGEMSPKEVHQRTLSRLLQVQNKVFRSKKDQTTEFLERVARAALESRRCIIYKKAPGLTFEELKRMILLAKVQKKVTGFILDYWQLVGGKPKGKSTSEHLDEVAQWIADACRKYEIWCIVMAQINQEGNTRGGEGIRLAFDQVYQMHAPNGKDGEPDVGLPERWLEMMDTRYTTWANIGSKTQPGLWLNERGPYFEEVSPGLAV